MEFDELIRGFGEKIGAGELSSDDSGTVTLAVDEMPLSIVHLDEIGMLALVGEVGEPPPEDRMEKLYRALLVANHNFTATTGATLSIDPESGKISMCRVTPLTLLDVDLFMSIVEGFVNMLETWRKIVSEYSGAASADGMIDDRSGADSPSEPEGAPDPLMGGPFMQV